MNSNLPPQNIEAEQGALGSMLLDNECVGELILFLRPEDFYRDSHQIICRSIYDLYERGKPADLITLIDELTRRDQFKAVGGDGAFSAIFDSVPHAANALHYAQIVKQKSVWRSLVEAANAIQREAYSQQKTAEEGLKIAEEQLFAIADQRSVGDSVPVGHLFDGAIARMLKRKGGEVFGLSAGLPDVDDATGGFQPQNLIILAARPSVGKTSLAMNIAEYNAIDCGKSVLFISLEMSKDELIDRIICARAGIPSHDFRSGVISPQQVQKAKDLRETILAAKLEIADTSGMTVSQIAALARRLKLRVGLDLIVVDYVQLVDPSNNEDRRNEQVAKVGRSLKRVARELNVPVIALSQLNRKSEDRDDNRPRMSELKESGDLEQDADQVILLWREGPLDLKAPRFVVTAIIAKNRNGRCDDVKLNFQRACMRFDSYAPPDPSIEEFSKAY